MFAKRKNQLVSLVQTVHIFSGSIGMQLGIKKCGVLIMETGKVIWTDGIRIPDGQHMKDVDETGYTYIGLLETDKIAEREMKETFSIEYLRLLRLILRLKLNGRNQIMTINTWAIWFRNSEMVYRLIKKLRQKTRKFMTMHGTLNPKSDVDRLYLSR